MKKAFIPLGIAGAFVTVGLVVTLTMSITTYIPETIVVEGAGGEDQTATSPETLVQQLSKTSMKDGTYYSSLESLPEDPEPVPGMYNSIAITCVGGGTVLGGTEFYRSLVVTQNHLGAFYQYDGWTKKNGIKNQQNSLIAISKHGMFVKYNSITITADEGVEIDETNKVIIQALEEHRGSWYKVACEEKLPSTMPATADGMIHYMAVYTCQMVVEQYYSQFINTLNSNNQLLDQLIAMITGAEFTTEDEKNYEGHIGSATVTLNFASETTPTIVLQSSGETETMIIEHIDNTKVRIIEKGAGDFYDMIGTTVEKIAREEIENMQ